MPNDSAGEFSDELCIYSVDNEIEVVHRIQILDAVSKSTDAYTIAHTVDNHKVFVQQIPQVES